MRRTIHNMSDRVVPDIQTRAEGEGKSCMSDTRQMRVL